MSSSSSNPHSNPVRPTVITSSSYGPSPGSASSSTDKGKAAVPAVPRNLRFQRRQSERAYLEDQYRDASPSMEYPAGTSPWASSPEASRHSFGGDDVPRQDLPAPAVQDPGQQHEGGASASAQYANGSGEQQQPPRGSVYSYQPGGPGSWSPDQQHQQPHWPQQAQYQQQQPHHHPHQQQQEHAEENRRPQSGRYHNLPPQQQQPRQPMPQYKLQAKITGLERTGKKDLILKFDVYVSIARAYLQRHMTDSLLDQPAQIPNHPVPRYSPHTCRVPKARLAPDSLQSRSLGSRCPACFVQRWHRHR